jgi:ribonucleotide reductase alpha subunit
LHIQKAVIYLLHQTITNRNYESNQNIFNKSKLPNFIRTGFSLVFFNSNNFKILMKDLIDCGMWTERVKNNIIANQGSVQQLEGLSEHLKQKYKTVWEIPMRHIIDMAADRGAYICQSQSLNLWMEDPNYAALTSMHFHTWQKGLKTGIYYLRRRHEVAG